MYGLEKNPPKSRTIVLDPNHSHFVFVDDDANVKLGQEAPFRIQLETEFRKERPEHEIGNMTEEKMLYSKKRRNSKESINSFGSIVNKLNTSFLDREEKQQNFSIPMILVCVNGGYDSLILIQESLKNRVPILMVKGTNGMADLVIRVFEYRDDQE